MKGLVKNEATVFLVERGATHNSTQIRKASAHILEGLENFHCLDFLAKRQHILGTALQTPHLLGFISRQGIKYNSF